VETDEVDDLGYYKVKVSNKYPDGDVLSTIFTITIQDEPLGGYNPWDEGEIFEKEINDSFLPEVYVIPTIHDVTHRGEVTITFSEPLKEDADLKYIKSNTTVYLFRGPDPAAREDRSYLLESWDVLGQTSGELLLKLYFLNHT